MEIKKNNSFIVSVPYFKGAPINLAIFKAFKKRQINDTYLPPKPTFAIQNESMLANSPTFTSI